MREQLLHLQEQWASIGLDPQKYSFGYPVCPDLDEHLSVVVEYVRQKRPDNWLDMGLLPKTARMAEKKYQEALKIFPHLSRDNVFEPLIYELYQNYCKSNT